MKNNLAECGEHIMIVERTILHFLVRKGLTEKSVLDAGREPRGELLQASAINTEFSQGTQLTPIHFVETHLVSTIMT